MTFAINTGQYNRFSIWKSIFLYLLCILVLLSIEKIIRLLKFLLLILILRDFNKLLWGYIFWIGYLVLFFTPQSSKVVYLH
jgi:hypothetical protein